MRVKRVGKMRCVVTGQKGGNHFEVESLKPKGKPPYEGEISKRDRPII